MVENMSLSVLASQNRVSSWSRSILMDVSIRRDQTGPVITSDVQCPMRSGGCGGGFYCTPPWRLRRMHSWIPGRVAVWRLSYMNHVKLFWRVDHCFGSKKRSGKVKTLGKDLHVSNLTFQELQYESWIEAIGAQELGVQKVGQNMDQVVPGKGDLTSKMAMFGGFFRSVPQKNWNFFCRRH